MAKSEDPESPPSRKPGSAGPSREDLLREMEELRARLEEAEETIHAIQTGGVDGLIVSGPEGDRVFALEGVDYAYRVLVDVMAEGVLTLDSDGTILSCNNRFATLVKAPAEEVLGRNIKQFVVRGALHSLHAFLQDPSRDGGFMNTNLVQTGGTTIPVKVSAGAYEVGGLPALCIVVTDMTAFYTTAKTQLWLASIVNGSHDAVISKTLNNTILGWNGGAERMFGYSAQETVGKPISIIVPPERAHEFDLIDGGTGVERFIDGFETVRLTKSGDPIHVALTVSPTRDMQGNITGASIIARDITERKRIEAELEEHRQHLEETVQKRTQELSERSEELQTANEVLQEQREELMSANEELLVQAQELHSQGEELMASNHALQISQEAEALRATELQAVLDTMPAAIMITHDPEARQIAGNRAAENMLGVHHGTNLAGAGWRGLKPETLFTAQDGVKAPQVELPLLRAAHERVTVWDCEYEQVSADGSVRHLLGNATPLDSGGAVAAFIDITERKRAEESLRQSEERFRLALKNSPVSVAVQDCDLVYQWAFNQQTRRTDEILGKRDEDLFPPEDLPLIREVKRRVLATGTEEHVQHWLTSNGSRMFLDLSYEPLRNADGEITGIGIAVVDLTQQKLAEEAVRRHSETLEAVNRILNAALTCETEEALGFACLEIAERITLSSFGFIGNINEEGLEDIAISNPGWEACLITDAGGHRLPPKAFKIHGIYGRVITDGKPVLTNAPANHPDAIGLPPGHPPLNAFLGVPLSHAGRTIGIVAVANREGGYTPEDQELLEALAPAITEAFLRRRAEDALKHSHEALEQRVLERTRELTDTLALLRESAARLDEAQRMARMGHWEWDIPANTNHWSDETFRLLGFEPQSVDLTYERFIERVHPADLQHLAERIKAALDSGEPDQVAFRVVLPKDGLRHLIAHGEMVFDDQGEPVRIAGTLLDITEQVQSREETELRNQQLYQADKMVSLGMLTSGVAHEINNPNHAIMTNAALFADAWTAIRPILEREYEESGDFVLAGFDYSTNRDQFPKMLQDIVDASRRIEAIVTELRDYARSSPEDSRSPIDVQPILESACQLLTSMIKKSTDRFDLSCDPDLPKICANRQRIEQVLINLIQNACQALPDREKGITVTAAYAPEKYAVVIVIKDEGTGIAEHNLTNLGNPFFTTKRGLGGTGLGLWVSFKIVREHGGTLDFHSIPGKGTRAELTLPITQEP